MDRILPLFYDPVFIITLVLSLILGIAGNFASDGIKRFFRRNSTKLQREYDQKQKYIESTARRCAAVPAMLQIETAELAIINQRVISGSIQMLIQYLGVLFLATYMSLRHPATGGNISDSLAQVLDTTKYQFSWSNFGSWDSLFALLFAWVVFSAIRTSFRQIPITEELFMHRGIIARTKQLLLADLDSKNQPNP